MQNPQNFITTTKLSAQQQVMQDEFSIQYISDEKGNDWYELAKLFDENTLKVQYDKTGLTVAADRDASKLFPLGCSVIELAESDVPADFTPGAFTFIDGVLTQIPIDYVAIATRRRDNEMASVSVRITALTEAQDDGDITEEEGAELAALREHRTKLRRLDLSAAPDIDWPAASAS